MTRVYFVRHAQSDYRSGSDRERGLTPEGLEDRRVVLDFLRDKPVDAFYCSPYRRSLDTIQEAADHFGLAIRTDERLRERESVPGGNVRELFQRRWADFDWHEEGGECLRSVQARNIAALTDILNESREKTVVIGTHGTALSTILHYYDPSFNCASFMRFIDWMPFVVELDFSGTELVSKTEHVYVEKVFVP